MRACRTCLTKTDLNPLFGDLSAVRFTSKQLYLATGVQIRPNDNLPQVACKSCIKQITKSLYFRYISSKTNVYLQQIIKKGKIKSELINNTVWTDDEDFDKYSDVNIMFVDIKTEHEYMQNSDIDNYQFDNSHNDLNHNGNDNNNFDNHKKYDRNVKGQPDNENKYLDDDGSYNNHLDNEGSDNNHLDNEQNCNSLSDNYHNYNKDNSQLDKHKIDNKQYSHQKNTKEQVTKAKIHRKSRKTSKNTIKKKDLDNKLKIKDNELKNDSCITSPKKLNIKIEEFESDSGNSDLTNNSSNKKEKAMKIKDICDGNINFNDGIKCMEDSKRNKVKIDRNICKLQRNKLMSLAVSPYQPEGPVQCKVCREYVKLSSFVMHAKRHFTPEFTCEECGKMFRSHAHMVYHQQRMHGKEKRLACSLCDYKTVDRLKLKNHERTHSGERPYKCDECGSTFRMRTNIVQHMRTHFGVKHVQCELCANLFRSKSELANHKNKVHNKLTYLCYLCPQTYRGKRAVRRHLINLHGVLDEQILKIKCVKSTKYEEVTTT